ncbi:hypothetical protein GYMLUDRAFT_41891, partial [Collybiopsis luxurians FD-317 M1]
MYHVFLGAPSAQYLLQSSDNNTNYIWTTISSSQTYSEPPPSVLLPPATLEAASRRISLMYQNAIFQDDEQDEEELLKELEVREGAVRLDRFGQQDGLLNKGFRRLDKTRSYLNMSTRFESQFETQETQESQSLDYSDSSSIARFPRFHFNLHSITSLANIRKKSGLDKKNQEDFLGYSNKINVLLAILEVDGPDTVRTKKGPDAGKEISVLKWILGDEDGGICKLTAWREIADAWGGSGPKDVAAKRGDVVLIQNVTTSLDPLTSPTLTASPNLKSKLEICYRTMPYAHEDLRFRPDLRLGGTDASVRKVASMVKWFERTAGISAS